MGDTWGGAAQVMGGVVRPAGLHLYHIAAPLFFSCNEAQCCLSVVIGLLPTITNVLNS